MFGELSGGGWKFSFDLVNKIFFLCLKVNVCLISDIERSVHVNLVQSHMIVSCEARNDE